MRISFPKVGVGSNRYWHRRGLRTPFETLPSMNQGRGWNESRHLTVPQYFGGQPASYENMIVFSIAGHQLTAGVEPALG